MVLIGAVVYLLKLMNIPLDMLLKFVKYKLMTILLSPADPIIDNELLTVEVFINGRLKRITVPYHEKYIRTWGLEQLNHPHHEHKVPYYKTE